MSISDYSNHPITISRVNHVRDNKPGQENTTWAAFIEGCRKPVVRGKLLLYEYLVAEKHIRDEQKNGKGIVCGPFRRPDTRSKDDLQALHIGVIDLDDGFYTWESLISAMSSTGLECVIHTSYSHSDKCGKYRVFVLYDEPITESIEETHNAIVDYYESVLGQHVDDKCRTISQIFYTPSCPPDAENQYRYIHLKGKPLHTADFKVRYPGWDERKEIIAAPSRGGRPGDDYNLRATVDEVVQLLEVLGWKIFTRGQKGSVHMTRPGKEGGTSGTVGFCETNLFQCHSSDPATTPFKGGETYAPFTVYAMVHHNGDFSAAAKALAVEGYGTPKQRNQVPASSDSSERDEPALLTDRRLKHYFAETYNNVVRYVPGIGWHRWDGKRWCTNTPGGLYPLIDQMVRILWEQSEAIQDEDLRMKRRKSLVNLEAHGRQTTLIEACQTVPALITGADQLDRDPMLLNCLNGTVELKTGILRPHSPENLITRIVNIEYDPSAECPIFQRFITWAMRGESDLISYLQRFIGYCLTGKTEEQILNFWYGTGGNGKTTLMNALQWLLGDYATTADTGLIMQRRNGTDSNRLSMLAGLRGSRIVTLSEVNDGEKLDEAAIKSFTGGDIITCRHLYEDFFSYTPQAKLIGFGNYKPHVRGTDNGIWRRIHLVPFLAVIGDEDKDPSLPEKLRTELPGILAWAARGCLEWQRVGLYPPATILEATREYRQAEDVFSNWLNECCSSSPGDSAVTGELFESFKKFSGWNSITPTKFGKTLSERGFTKRKTNGKVFWDGLKLEISDTSDSWTPFSQKSYKKNDSESFVKMPSTVTSVTGSERKTPDIPVIAQVRGKIRGVVHEA